MYVAETLLEKFADRVETEKYIKENPLWYKFAFRISPLERYSHVRPIPRLGQIIDAQNLVVNDTYTRILITDHGYHHSYPPFKLLTEPFEVTSGERRIRVQTTESDIPYENRQSSIYLHQLGIEPDLKGFWNLREYLLAGRVTLPLPR